MGRRLWRMFSLSLQPVGFAADALAVGEILLLGFGFSLATFLLTWALALLTGLKLGLVGGVAFVAMVLLLLVCRTAYRLLKQTDEATWTREHWENLGQELHVIVQEGREFISRAPGMPKGSPDAVILMGQAEEWSIKARGFIYENFSPVEASLFEHNVPFVSTVPIMERFQDGLTRRIEFLMELQNRIAERLWTMAPRRGILGFVRWPP